MAATVRSCLHEGGLAIGDVDFVGFYDKPLLKFERIRLVVLLAQEARRTDVPFVILYATGKAQIIAGDGATMRSAGVIPAAAEEGVPFIGRPALGVTPATRPAG